MQILLIIHHIHRFKSSDWLKEGHMTWIIFDNVHVWKLIHCVSFYYFPDSRRSCHSCQIWNSLAYSDFTGSVRAKKSMMGCIKQILAALLFRMVENYCTLGKTQPWLLFTSALWASVNSRPGLSFTSGQ